jgi:hypothetical protein
MVDAMADGCLDSFKTFFVYLKFQLILQYTAVRGSSMTCKWQDSSTASCVLAMFTFYYFFNSYNEASKFLKNMSRMDNMQLKFSILMLCQRAIVSIFLVWLQQFSRNSRQIFERIAKNLQRVDDLLCTQPGRKRRIMQFVTAFIILKTLTIIAVMPLVSQKKTLFMKFELMSDIFVNCMEDTTEQVFILFCSEIHARLEKFQVIFVDYLVLGIQHSYEIGQDERFEHQYQTK